VLSTNPAPGGAPPRASAGCTAQAFGRGAAAAKGDEQAIHSPEGSPRHLGSTRGRLLSCVSGFLHHALSQRGLAWPSVSITMFDVPSEPEAR
jgi:hypothetical protein